MREVHSGNVETGFCGLAGVQRERHVVLALAEHGNLLWRVGLGTWTMSAADLAPRWDGIPMVQMMLVRR